MPDALDMMFDLLQHETSPLVRAVLGHWLMGYIHPFPDGNGRTARFLMNAMLASGGVPWLIVRFENRAEYLESLEQASVGGDALPFARFIIEGTAGKFG
ncbi:Fic family protein [Hyphomicrobium sp. LHD-15]|uniref:Fic family protein n=1 Tax=Hyphomicrobium sp. LHD-15 TaxID=3072142 RepID=UPI00280D0F2D|nr:Fic family protein [Hyphomicrobium sp. LHD-15]MDQ8700619.1 Fic family protein [Hyphomicrobium sp. LHD-15]